jgi:hypothetical protein
MWSGGPGQGATVEVKGGRSYYCIYGEVQVPARTQAPAVAARRLYVSLNPLHPNWNLIANESSKLDNLG